MPVNLQLINNPNFINPRNPLGFGALAEQLDTNSRAVLPDNSRFNPWNASDTVELSTEAQLAFASMQATATASNTSDASSRISVQNDLSQTANADVQSVPVLGSNVELPRQAIEPIRNPSLRSEMTTQNRPELIEPSAENQSANTQSPEIVANNQVTQARQPQYFVYNPFKSISTQEVFNQIGQQIDLIY
ncbi:hypothetical protein ACFL54_01585 [Planctomycetota bacterium]